MESFLTADIQNLSDQELIRSRDQIIEQVAWARCYTLQLLESVSKDIWYVKPAGASSHLAWQVGHLAVSQYGLMLFRQRGRAPGDLELLPGWLRKKFGRGTQPADFADDMPTADELQTRLAKIHDQALLEASKLEPAVLRESTDMPYTTYPNKLGALLFCPIHEAIHSGQIGLLRRLHGLEPVR